MVDFNWEQRKATKLGVNWRNWGQIRAKMRNTQKERAKSLHVHLHSLPISAAMAPKEWATQPQLEYLCKMLPKYRDACAGFSCYPVKAKLGIIVSSPGAEPPPPEKRKLIGNATTKTKKCLRTWMHWRAKPRAVVSKRSTLFQILKRKKKTRPLRALEVDQKIHRTKIRSKAEERKVEDQAVEHVHANCATCMSILRTTAMELFAAEPEDVRAEVLAQMEEMNREHALGLRDDISGMCVPEEYQQPAARGGVKGQRVHREGDWVDGVVHGGRTDAESFCFGTTPNSADFAASHSNFGEVKGEFSKFLKRTFPHNVHDTWGIVSEPEVATIPGGLIQFDRDLNNESDDEGEEASPVTAPSKVKPKRVCRKKLTAPVSATVSPGWCHAHPVPTLALSALATDPVFPIPNDFNLTIQDTVTNFNGINGVTTEQEDAVWALGLADSWDGIVPPTQDPEAASPWNGLSLPSTQGKEDASWPRGMADFTSFSAPDSGSVPAFAACSATLCVTLATSASATITTPTLPALAASATLMTLAATPLECTPTPTTPAGGPPHSAAALAVWNAHQHERMRTADPAPANAASSTVCKDPPPSPEVPEVPESRPQANIPCSHPLAPVKRVMAKKAPMKKKAGGCGRGRPRKNGGAVVEEGEEREGGRGRRKKSPIVRKVTKKWGDMVASQLAIPLTDPNARQVEMDTALLACLKKGKCKADAPAAPKRKSGGTHCASGAGLAQPGISLSWVTLNGGSFPVFRVSHVSWSAINCLVRAAKRAWKTNGN
ncbi:hypothetical protein B0H14DRAFT_2576453 [Mycena olivaceomarginata]|nr:hypothetical protein B0H14DRAFT_2576453 [Mycena olivaceomarginata]